MAHRNLPGMPGLLFVLAVLVVQVSVATLAPCINSTMNKEACETACIEVHGFEGTFPGFRETCSTASFRQNAGGARCGCCAGHDGCDGFAIKRLHCCCEKPKTMVCEDKAHVKKASAGARSYRAGLIVAAGTARLL
eukprot:TRINITY_DN52921_c0_g1_i1.p2 TRINITY_DN52921_c0_g1~~TRINITY_DN52921_c0_g1_i1.p2  ORF type:complete len:136 (-),score=13.75 TRINITY_DN52921_c0_g1_i1:109-516(-)